MWHNIRDGLLEKSKLIQYAYKEGHRVIGDKNLGFWKAKATEGTGNKGIGLDGMLNQTNQETQFRHLSHLDRFYQQ